MMKKARWTLLLPLVAILLLVALRLIAETPFSMLRNAAFDQYQRWQPRVYTETPVKIINIDEASLARIGQWPWPRNRLAELVDRLTAANVAAIGFDVMFAEADRTSPAEMADLWQLKPELRRQILTLPNHDARFAASLKTSDSVLGFSVLRTEFSGQPALAGKNRLVNLGEPQNHWLHPFDTTIDALPILASAAKGKGALSFVPDNDGVIRRIPLVFQLPDGPVPTLVSETLRVAQGAPVIMLRSAGHMQQLNGKRDNNGLGEIRIGDFFIPSTPQGEFWIHYTPHQPERSLSAWKIFSDDAALAGLAGHIVLVGSSAQGLMDLRFSPFGLIPGVEAHAQALEQILSGHFLERPSWAIGSEFAALIIGSLIVGFLALLTGALPAAAACLLLLTLTTGGSWLAFAKGQLLIDPALPSVGILFTFLVCSLTHHFIVERERRWIKAAFSRYVSPNRVAHLIEHQDEMALGGRRQQCSFIFTDLVGFTHLMEGIDPGAAVTLLNDYLDEMIAIAFRHEGTLDRIVGDAVAIMFSAPLAQTDHCARALACALEMDAFASASSDKLIARGIPFGATRIGVHAGEVIVGNFGGKTMFDYRALGDAVNTASRLESANQHLGTQLCISEAILAGTPKAKVRPVGKIVLKGKTQPLAVFEALGQEPARASNQPDKRAPVDVYLPAYQALNDAPAEASARFADLHARFPEDGLVAMHHQRLQKGKSGDLIILDEK